MFYNGDDTAIDRHMSKLIGYPTQIVDKSKKT